MSKALIVVDVQNDFCEGGALAVDGGNAVAEGILEHIEQNSGDYETIVYTKDWHKPWPHTNGGHFSETPDFVDSWPVHCVQGTEGAEFHWAVEDAHARHAVWNLVFRKGDGRPDYSGFQGFNDQNTSLEEWLSDLAVDEVDVVGIAGDYCVRETALDAKRKGFKVNIIESLVASVRGPEATQAMIDEVAELTSR